jgi:DNA repair exonuclease SbcCD ATPase subunit
MSGTLEKVLRGLDQLRYRAERLELKPDYAVPGPAVDARREYNDACMRAMPMLISAAAECARLREEGADECRNWQRARIGELTHERDEARAEAERLREELDRLGSQVGELLNIKDSQERRIAHMELLKEQRVERLEDVRRTLEIERNDAAKALAEQNSAALLVQELQAENAALRAALEPLEEIARRRAGNVRTTNTLSSDVAADHWLALADAARAVLNQPTKGPAT